MAQGRIKPLWPAPHFDQAVIERSAHIVGMMGAEPFIRALQAGADVVIAGRASDTAIFASVPLMLGFPAGPAWHAAKILECGAAAVVNRRTPDCMFAWLRRDHFVVEAPDETLRCTPQSIASHSLYENADPFKLVECSGTLDLTQSEYEAVSERAVKVTGSTFLEAKEYTVKLEGAERAGYQSILIGSIRDPFIIRQIDDWTDRLKTRIATRGEDGVRRSPLATPTTASPSTSTARTGPWARSSRSRKSARTSSASYSRPPRRRRSSPTRSPASSATRRCTCRFPNGAASSPRSRCRTTRSIAARCTASTSTTSCVPDDPYEMFPMELIDVGVRAAAKARA